VFKPPLCNATKISAGDLRNSFREREKRQRVRKVSRRVQLKENNGENSKTLVRFQVLTVEIMEIRFLGDSAVYIHHPDDGGITHL
jgi:hypothetical protein